MATKSCLLFISLIAMIVIVSADRLHVVDRNRASEGLGVPKTVANAVSADRPHVVDRNPASKGLGVSKRDTNVNMMSKLRSAGKTNNHGNGLNGMKATVSPMIPVPMPAVDGQFQFQLGPIGFGWNWNFGGGVPGPLIAYSQPIVVSPYSPQSNPTIPYIGVMPSPYANVQPYQQQPGEYHPLPGYFGFYPGGYHRSPFGRYGPYPSGQYAQGANQMRRPASGHE